MGIDYYALEQQATEQFHDPAFALLSNTFVPGEGDNPEAFIIGEAPGAQEETKRRPFIGPAGNVLRQLMALADLYAAADGQIAEPVNCWVTNVVKFRPPRNRNPTDAEINAARPYIREEWIAVGKPKLIIPVGGIALRAVTGKKISLFANRLGKCHYYTAKSGEELAIWPMVHPSFGLRNPKIQPLLEEDWERLATWRNNVQ